MSTFAFVCILLLFPSILSENENACRKPPFTNEAEKILQILGYTESCASASVIMCKNKCETDFKSIISEIEKKSNAAFLAMNGITDVLEKLSKCLEIASEEVPDEILTDTYGLSDVANCLDVKNKGFHKSGVYTVYPFENKPDRAINVYCDQVTDGGGWTVFLNRDSLSTRINFDRNWTEYENGFGNFTGEFWLGLDAIHELSKGKTELRVDLQDADGNQKYAKYSTFKVDAVSTNYKLTVSGYQGDAGDALGKHNAMMFTTYDRDNDRNSGNCAVIYKGGWWSLNCHYTKLTGVAAVGKIPYAKGITWNTFRGFEHSHSKAKMMIRPS